MKKVTFFISLVFYFLSCKKAEDRICFKSTGESTYKLITIGDFNELNLGPKLNYTLVNDSTNFLKITGGQNLLNAIQVDLNNGILSIENKNKCNFLRNYDHTIHVEIHYTQLNRVDGRISHELNTLDTIRGNYFNLRISGASGNANLLVDTEFLNGFVNDGSPDYRFSGKTKFAHIQAHGNGSADVRTLDVAEKLEITSRSNRPIFCRAEGIPLVVNIEFNGDVYYNGTPSSIQLNKTGSGQLIHMN